MSKFTSGIKNTIAKISTTKLNKTSFEVLLILWMLYVSISYLKTYGYLFFAFSLCITFGVFAILFSIFYKKNKKSFLLSIKTLFSFFSKNRKYSISASSLLIAFPFFAILITVCLLLFLFQNGLYTSIHDISIVKISLSLLTNIFLPYIFYIILVLLVTSIGLRLLRIFNFKPSCLLDTFLYSQGLGFMPITFGTLLLLSLKLLYPISVLLLLSLLAVFSFREIRLLLTKTLNYKISFTFSSAKDKLRIAVVAIMGLVLALNFALVTKPLPNSTDDLHTYFNVPLLYSGYHGLKPMLHIDTANLGQNTEMIYTAIISLLGPSFVVHFSLLMLGFSLLGFYALTKKIKDRSSALLSTIVLLFIPWNFYYIHTSKVEFFLAFYGSLLLLVFFDWQKEKKNKKLLYLISVLSGFSLGIKYSSILLLIPLAIVMLFQLYKKDLIVPQMRSLTIGLLLVLATFSPWAIKNTVFFSNPVYPYGRMVFSEKQEANLTFNNEYRNKRGEEIKYLRHGLEVNKYSPFSFLRSVWNQSIGTGINRGSWINFCVFPFLLLPFLWLKKRKETIPFATIGTIYFFLWYIFDGSRAWYALPGIMLLYSLLALCVRKNNIAIGILLITMVSSSVLGTIIIPTNTLYATGLVSKNEYVQDTIPYYNTAMFVNKLNLTSENKILLAGDFRVALIEHNDEIMSIDPYLGRSGYALSMGSTNFKELLKNNSIGYIIYSNMLDGYEKWLLNKETNKDEYLKILPENTSSIFKDIDRLKNFINNNAELLYSDNVYSLYKVRF